MYLLREMSGHKVKKNTLYFEVRHTIYLFATLIPAVCAVVEAFNPVTSSSFPDCVKNFLVFTNT